MPHYTMGLLQTLLRLPGDSMFLLVYESTSDDGVHGWIYVLQLAINVIGTHNRVVTRGMLVRTHGQERIQFLAQVRNMAMAPLYYYYARTDRDGAADSSSSGGGDQGRKKPRSSSSTAFGTLPWDPDYIVFINDVYFCWSMVLRLMNYRADITCGTDWWQNKGTYCDASAKVGFWIFRFVRFGVFRSLDILVAGGKSIYLLLCCQHHRMHTAWPHSHLRAVLGKIECEQLAAQPARVSV
eukprot:GHUV01047432.1.p1 GENE.GHUV01047432.1~~GHUV01047432.1.p1  ORF type:complete len:239 (-),score=20.39 GHUV01047432.1:3-719(-)